MIDCRILVTGSRDWVSPLTIFRALDQALAEHATSVPGDDWHVTVVHGKCDPWHSETNRPVPWRRAIALPDSEQERLLGADWHASRWVRIRTSVWGDEHVSEDARPADWYPAPFHNFDLRAGFKRNTAMVGLGAARGLAFLNPCIKRTCTRRLLHDSHGSTHCAGEAAKAGIPMTEFRP